MINGKCVAVVMPAYNAEHTLEATVRELPEIVDRIILVDDHSSDATVKVAKQLGLDVFVHERNRGYGGNQKTCYTRALECGADVIVMLHPDYQYSPRLVTAMASMVSTGVYDLVLASRILGGKAMGAGMPLYKYVSNRVLTLIQNLMFGAKLSEYHTGFRAYTREFLLSVPLENNSDDFVFDNQVLAQALYRGTRIGEISCPAKYAPECSSINMRRSIVYGLGVLATTLHFCLAKWEWYQAPIFRATPVAEAVLVAAPEAAPVVVPAHPAP